MHETGSKLSWELAATDIFVVINIWARLHNSGVFDHRHKPRQKPSKHMTENTGWYPDTGIQTLDLTQLVAPIGHKNAYTFTNL